MNVFYLFNDLRVKDEKKRVQHFLSSAWTREDVEPHQRLRVESPKRGATGREEGVLQN